MSAITLRCGVCGGSWEMERRRGQYPTVCPECQAHPVAVVVERECRVCGEPFRVEKRKGAYPVVCGACRELRAVEDAVRRSARSLARFARSAGLRVQVKPCRIRGWAVWCETPWHSLPVVLEDHADVRFLLSEMNYRSRRAA